MQGPPAQRAASLHRLAAVTALGFASGLPLALTGQALQAWLSVDGIDVATIGFMSLVGLPYTFKFLWAPLLDRFELPWLGRRRGWLVLMQLLLAAALLALSATRPSASIRAFALLALVVAFVSASQDVVIDAYRTDLLAPRERGFGGSLTVVGYRLAMILSGGIALIWTDPVQGGGMTWPAVYRLMAALMVGAAAVSALLRCRAWSHAAGAVERWRATTSSASSRSRPRSRSARSSPTAGRRRWRARRSAAGSPAAPCRPALAAALGRACSR